MIEQDNDHERCLRRLIAAHQRVVERWNVERPRDLFRLKGITKAHTHDALYRPFECQYEIEEEFYDEVDEELSNLT